MVPITDLRQDAAAVLRRLKGSDEAVVITQRGRAAAVLLSPESYEKGRQERELLRRIARGEKDIAEGADHSLDSVLRDADVLLENEA
jgi:prevent-host-death family protein